MNIDQIKDKIIKSLTEKNEIYKGENFVENFSNNKNPPSPSPFCLKGIKDSMLVTRRVKYSLINISIIGSIIWRLYMTKNKSMPITKRVEDFLINIPFIGFIIWWLYMIIKLPTKFSNLYGSFDVKSREFDTRFNELYSNFDNFKRSFEINLDDVLVVKRVYMDTDSYISKAIEGSKLSVEDSMDKDMFYYLFENLFRGSEKLISSRQTVYLPYVKEAFKDSKSHFFMDIGCGRGEFLNLLKKNEIPAKGVDINKDFVKMLTEKGFDVTLSDAMEYLEQVENNSLIGLSMFQVIEHVEFNYMDNLIKKAFKRLSQNGIIILETVNPLCPMAMGSFYTDPTHIRPYPPDMMKFILEWHGFRDVQIIFSSPVPAHLRSKEAALNYLDYAVIGKKL